MYKGLPKITKNLIMTENKFKDFKDWGFLTPTDGCYMRTD